MERRNLLRRRVFGIARVGMAIALLFLFALPVLTHSGGPYELSWRTIGGGGATFSSVGGFTLGGTASRLDAGFLSGGGLTLTGGVWATEAQTGTRLYLDPNLTLVTVNQVFTLDIKADLDTSTADTVDAYIDFDPTYLEVVDASGTPATAIELNTDVFGSATFNAVDNATGQINFSATKFDSPLTGTFTAATIRFRARAAAEDTRVSNVRSGARMSDLYQSGEPLNATLGNGSVTIAAPTCPDFVDPPGVGVEDVQMVAAHRRARQGEQNYVALYDRNGDGVINIVDIMKVVAAWGTCP